MSDSSKLRLPTPKNSANARPTAGRGAHLLQLVLVDLGALLRGVVKGVAHHAALRPCRRLGHKLVVDVWGGGRGGEAGLGRQRIGGIARAGRGFSPAWGSPRQGCGHGPAPTLHSHPGQSAALLPAPTGVHVGARARGTALAMVEEARKVGRLHRLVNVHRLVDLWGWVEAGTRGVGAGQRTCHSRLRERGRYLRQNQTGLAYTTPCYPLLPTNKAAFRRGRGACAHDQRALAAQLQGAGHNALRGLAHHDAAHLGGACGGQGGRDAGEAKMVAALTEHARP